MRIRENSRNNFYIRCINFFHMLCTKFSKSSPRRWKELDKLICIHLERRNLFNLADNSGVSMENRQL